MTDVASEPVPAPAPTEPVATVTFGTPAPADDLDKSTVDSVKEKAAELADQAGDALEKAGDAVQDAAGKAYDATMDAASNVVTRIRNNATLPAARGRTTIANEVVEKIAGIAAREVPGVYDLGGDVARVFSAVRERVGLGDTDADQGVSVRLEGSKAAVKVVLVIEYGFVVYSVT